MAYNFAKRLKTLRGLTPYQFICQQWQKSPLRFSISPFHHTVGLNTKCRWEDSLSNGMDEDDPAGSVHVGATALFGSAMLPMSADRSSAH